MTYAIMIIRAFIALLLGTALADAVAAQEATKSPASPPTMPVSATVDAPAAPKPRPDSAAVSDVRHIVITYGPDKRSAVVVLPAGGKSHFGMDEPAAKPATDGTQTPHAKEPGR